MSEKDRIEPAAAAASVESKKTVADKLRSEVDLFTGIGPQFADGAGKRLQEMKDHPFQTASELTIAAAGGVALHYIGSKGGAVGRAVAHNIGKLATAAVVTDMATTVLPHAANVWSGADAKNEGGILGQALGAKSVDYAAYGIAGGIGYKAAGRAARAPEGVVPTFTENGVKLGELGEAAPKLDLGAKRVVTGDFEVVPPKPGSGPSIEQRLAARRPDPVVREGKIVSESPEPLVGDQYLRNRPVAPVLDAEIVAEIPKTVPTPIRVPDMAEFYPILPGAAHTPAFFSMMSGTSTMESMAFFRSTSLAGSLNFATIEGPFILNRTFVPTISAGSLIGATKGLLTDEAKKK